MTKRMKLAVVLDNEEIDLWKFRILEEISRTGCADISLLMLNTEKYNEVKNNQYSWFYLLYEKLDKIIFKNKIDFDKKVNVLEQIRETPVIKLHNTDPNGGLINAGLNNTHNYNTDIILNFGNTPIHCDLLKECRFGVLTYSIGNYGDQNIAPSCYWEVVNSLPEIETTIYLTSGDQDKKTEIFRTGILPYSNSVNVNRNNAYELASLLIPRIINGIAENGNAFLDTLIKNYKNNKELTGCSRAKPPYALRLFPNLILLFSNFIIKNFLHLDTGYWFLILKLNHGNELFPTDPGSFKVLKAPKGKFWADPFVICKDRHHYLFVEEYIYKTGKGHISVLKLDEKGNLLSNERIIEKPYHLSYPHVFEYDGSYYMVPESGSNNTIQLYKCSTFPDKWIFVKNIMENIPAKDTTLFFYNNKWWLFTSIIGKTTSTMSYNELFLYFSDDLFTSNWQSHPMNPVVSDHKLSRPAGKIFIDNNKIYRPSQDCSGIYGRALNINCITKLSETEYEEILIQKTEPIWDKKVIGTHTYNFNDKIMVMDVFSDRRRFSNN